MPVASQANRWAALAILRRESRDWNAPGTHPDAAEKQDPFLTLIGCILSLRTNGQDDGKSLRRGCSRKRERRLK